MPVPAAGFRRQLTGIKAAPPRGRYTRGRRSTVMILESSVEHREGCVRGGAWQGTTTRNSGSIARSCNAARCRHERTIRGVAPFTQKMKLPDPDKALIFRTLNIANSGQLGILGLSGSDPSVGRGRACVGRRRSALFPDQRPFHPERSPNSGDPTRRAGPRETRSAAQRCPLAQRNPRRAEPMDAPRSFRTGCS